MFDKTTPPPKKKKKTPTNNPHHYRKLKLFLGFMVIRYYSPIADSLQPRDIDNN